MYLCVFCCRSRRPQEEIWVTWLCELCKFNLFSYNFSGCFFGFTKGIIHHLVLLTEITVRKCVYTCTMLTFTLLFYSRRLIMWFDHVISGRTQLVNVSLQDFWVYVWRKLWLQAICWWWNYTVLLRKCQGRSEYSVTHTVCWNQCYFFLQQSVNFMVFYSTSGIWMAYAWPPGWSMCLANVCFFKSACKGFSTDRQVAIEQMCSG